jgi:nucleotide-binding universal stress UspA family protein
VTAGEPHVLGIRHVLLGVDGGESSAKALAWTRQLAAATGASVTVVCAFDEPWSVARPGSVALAGFHEALEGDARAVAGAAAETLRADGIEVEAVAYEGAPDEAVVSLCEERGADIVVVGGGGHRAARDILLGSSAERIVRFARVPVLVVK